MAHNEYRDPDLNIQRLVTISEANRHYSPKFKTHVHDYAITFNIDLLPPIEDLYDVFTILYETFVYVFHRLLRDYSRNDYVRIVIISESFDVPVQLPYVPVSSVSVDMVFDAIADVLNSQQDFDITDGFKVHVTRTVLPGGTGRHDRSSQVSFDEWISKKSKTVIRIPNEDNMCLARAIVVAIEEKRHLHYSKHHFRRFVNEVGPSSKQTEAALALHDRASIATNKPYYDLTDVAEFQKSLLPDYIIHVYDRFLSCIFQDYLQYLPSVWNNTHIYLLLSADHFMVIQNMRSFTGRRQFCDACQEGFRTLTHPCTATKCKMCHNISCRNINNAFSSTKIDCSICGKTFYSVCCEAAHVCLRSERCNKCNKFYRIDQQKRHLISCGKFRCQICNAFFDPPREDHFCFVQRLPRADIKDCSESDDSAAEMNERKPVDDILFWYDFETVFVDTGTHVPNLLVCASTEKTHIFKEKDLLLDFFNMISSYRSRTKGRLIFTAHNSAGFDRLLVLQGAYEQGLTPKVFYRGSKILMLEFCQRVRFICSFQLLPFSLRVLGQNFGLKQQKLYFPYLMNQAKYLNQKVEFPEERFFNPHLLRPDAYKQFKEAYDKMKIEYALTGKLYDVSAELEKYCIADTLVLRDICLSFSSEFEAMTSLKPFSTGITLPSVCLTLYRQQHLPASNMLPVFPHDGIATKTRHSKICAVWLQWESKKRGGIYIQGAHNTGEVSIEPYLADGFYRDPISDKCTVFEFYGCAYHSCEEHYPDPNGVNYLTNTTHRARRIKNLQKQRFLINTPYGLVEKWECQFRKEFHENDDLQKLAREVGLIQMKRLIPRDALYGGRVEVFNMYAEHSLNQSINYYDFVSLYPTVMESGEYSIGKPRIIYGFELGPVKDIDFTKFRGLLHIKVLPPSNILIGVLPYKTKEYGLTFPLCASCAITCQRTQCKHRDYERAMIGAWSHIELNIALLENYEVVEVYEIYHFEQCSTHVFKSYIKHLWQLRLHLDPSVEINDFFNVGEDLLHVTYSAIKDTRTRGNTCLMVAIETTAMARMQLFKLLKSVGSDRLVYCDTDSVIFKSSPMDWKPPTGNLFGQLTDEIAGKYGSGYINRFVALGCKTYAMEIIDEQDGRQYETRCKGISLNIRTMKNINFDTMLNLLKNDVHGQLFMEEPYFIQRVKRESKLLSVFRRKVLQFTFRKRVVDFTTFATVPLGYCLLKD